MYPDDCKVGNTCWIWSVFLCFCNLRGPEPKWKVWGCHMKTISFLATSNSDVKYAMGRCFLTSFDGVSPKCPDSQKSNLSSAILMLIFYLCNVCPITGYTQLSLGFFSKSRYHVLNLCDLLWAQMEVLFGFVTPEERSWPNGQYAA